MPRSARYVAIALGLILFGGVAFSQETPDTPLKNEPVAQSGQKKGDNTGQGSSDQNQNSSMDYSTAIKGVESAIRDLIAKEDKIQRERKNKRQKDDLQAQKDMAFWAKLMFLASAITIGVTFVGLVLIGFTLKYTKTAADHTKDMLREATDTTAAAKEANVIAKETQQIETRAWMTYFKWDTHINAPTVGNIEAVGISLQWKNTGKTPAFKLKCVTSCDEQIDFDELVQGFNESDAVPSAIGPGVEFGAPIQYFSIEQAMISKDTPMTIRCRIDYETVNGIACHSDVTMRIIYIGRADLTTIQPEIITSGNFVVHPFIRQGAMT